MLNSRERTTLKRLTERLQVDADFAGIVAADSNKALEGYSLSAAQKSAAGSLAAAMSTGALEPNRHLCRW